MRKLFLCASALVLMTACSKPAYETADSEANLPTGRTLRLS